MTLADHPLPASDMTCPACRTQVDAAMETHAGSRGPGPGDVVVCSSCAEVLLLEAEGESAQLVRWHGPPPSAAMMLEIGRAVVAVRLAIASRSVKGGDA